MWSCGNNSSSSAVDDGRLWENFHVTLRAFPVAITRSGRLNRLTYHDGHFTADLSSKNGKIWTHISPQRAATQFFRIMLFIIFVGKTRTFAFWLTSLRAIHNWRPYSSARVFCFQFDFFLLFLFICIYLLLFTKHFNSFSAHRMYVRSIHSSSTNGSDLCVFVVVVATYSVWCCML